jgi:hypothetical protein
MHGAQLPEFKSMIPNTSSQPAEDEYFISEFWGSSVFRARSAVLDECDYLMLGSAFFMQAAAPKHKAEGTPVD